MVPGSNPGGPTIFSEIMKVNRLKKNINFIRKFFRSVNWYEAFDKKKIRKIKKENFKLIVLKTKNNIKKLNLEEYFKKNKFKIKRLNKKNYFLALVKKNKILSSGWIYFGSRWKIEEIEKKIKLNSNHLLYDFETPKKLRNKGYYQSLLKLIRNRFMSKKLAIYSLSSNIKSNRAIGKSGFKLIKRINGLRN